MKRKFLSLLGLLAFTLQALAVANNTVEIKYNGQTATVSVASNISSYVTVSSGTSSHVKIVQAATFNGINPTTSNPDGEVIYVLSGVSADGEFYLEGSYKCTVNLNGLTLTNPAGPAINIQNGKRVEVSAKSGTTNTLTDGVNDTYNGCFHCKGHTKLKGKGTLNIVGKSKHALYSKEYLEVKNLTLNITAAQKDGIHCKEYFLMESGTVKISGVAEDGIQVELASDPVTGITTDHEDENTGNFYMTGGTLTISSYGGKAVKADGTISFSKGTCNFDTSDIMIHASIETVGEGAPMQTPVFYDMNGRRCQQPLRNGVYIMRQGMRSRKVTVN